MENPSLVDQKLTVGQVRDQFEQWRNTREKRTDIPTELWQAAISLAEHTSVYQISKALRLNYTDLKHRVEAQRGSAVPAAVNDSAFIELGVGPVPAASECIVEMEDKQGLKMKMCFKGEIGFDLLELGKAFLDKQS